ncbi:GAF domain-containing protein [Sulfitobacter albidus]|uniref:GAF domain-containing protein n=1 Tax=Sulfitobacter albidus TaxID=2829501 RepID=A0A975PNT5_9RHOB|nr:GAF domain-containing protein [Sulfitobacter albidus]QUJ77660.1 GAF domain-containing protein [Sulfitobacter albidus]
MKVVDINGGPPRGSDPGGSETERVAHNMVYVFSLPALPIKQRFSILLNRMCSTLDMDYGYITLPQEPVSAVPFFSARMVVRPPRPGKPTLSHLMSRSRNALHFDTPDDAPSGDYIDQTGHVPYRFAGAPVVFDGRVYGTVEFGGARPGAAPITSEHLMLVRILSGLAAGSLVLLSD